MHYFIFIAHRGLSSRAPENTISAFDLALAEGFSNIELDVQLSANGVPVIIHDDTVDRTTNGVGTVASFNLNELRRLDAGSWFNVSFKGELIPTLEEVLKRYAAKAHLHLELKSEQPELPEKVVRLLRQYGWLEDSQSGPFEVPGLTITSEHIAQLERSKQLLPSVAHHWMSRNINKNIIAKALIMKLQGLVVTPQYIDQEAVIEAKRRGLIVRGMAAKSDEDIRTLFRAGAKGTTTNWPDKGSQALKSAD